MATKRKVKEKTISVDYFQTKQKLYKNGVMAENNTYDLVPILTACKKVNVEQRKWTYNGDTARFQAVNEVDENKKYDNLKGCNNLWEMQFVRISKDLLPGVATDEGEYDPALLSKLLGDNQGIAESVSAIYDSDLCVLVIQRNSKGILPSGILEFFQERIKDKSIDFDAIDLDIDIKKLKRDGIYRMIEIGFAELKRDTVINTRVKQLNSIINSVKQYGPVTTRITMSMSKTSRKNSLEQELSLDTVMDLNKNPYINRLRLKTSESPDTDVETIDLVEQRLKDDFKIKYSKDNPITHDKVIMGLLGSYSKNRPDLKRKLKIEE